MDLARTLDLRALLEKKSFFLFGPRATGKSFLIDRTLATKAVVVDLLRSDMLLRLAAEPHLLEGMIDASPHAASRVVVIDEIQKLPSLLDEVHRLIERRNLRFLLTGSSARKLRRGAANLLAGRAWHAELFPLTSVELPTFDLDRYLRFGGLPAVALSSDPAEELHAYVRTYLYEEIQAEGLVRKLPLFSRFLLAAALTNGQMVNFAQVASDSGVPASTVREYYGILEDTLVGFMLRPWTKYQKRKAISTAKFFLFDTGVAHAIAGTESIDRNSDLYGRSFEHFVAMELRAFLSYRRNRLPLSYWRSKHGHEVDFIVGDDTAIEVKATRHIVDRDLRGVKALKEERLVKRVFGVSQDDIETTRDGIACVNWRTFLERLWAGRIV